jgi:3'(2'), 5'-bisphosphate nucleotidase
MSLNPVAASPSLIAELETAERLAREGGAAAMEFYGLATSQAKAGESPVTEADHAANRVITSGLATTFPADAILSEETRDSRARLDAERLWVVDPLDGTKEFLAQNGEFSIMIGLAIGGRAVLGVVYCPAIDVLYAAAEGQGSWVEQGGERRPLTCAPAPGPEPRPGGARSHPDPLLVRMQQALGITDVLPCGSVGVKCARIAERVRDLYIHPVPFLKEWDTCAPEVMLREAGGVVTDCRGEQLAYNKPEPTQPYGILACAPGVFEAVLPTVRELYAA